MLDWLKNINKHPEFWKEYVSKFDTKSKRFVILSTETSGLNPNSDVIISMGSVAIVNDAIVIADSFEVTLQQYKYLHDHELSNKVIIDSKHTKLSESEAIQGFIEYIGNAVLVGHRIHFDVDLINIALEKLHCGRLKNEALDIEIMYKKLQDIHDKSISLDELCTAFKISAKGRHTSSEDAYKIALLFLKLKKKLRIR